MSSLTLDDHRCPGCGRVAEIVGEHAATITDRVVLWDASDDSGPWFQLRCGHDDCGFTSQDGRDRPTVRHMLLTEDWSDARYIGPGLGRLLVEALERGATPAEFSPGDGFAPRFLPAHRPNMAPNARQMVERARAADPTAYADAGPRNEYTSAPPPPTPEWAEDASDDS